MADLSGKTALVTGAARRVGRSIAEALARRGMNLALHFNRSRRESLALAAQLRRSSGVRVEVFRADLRDVPEIKRMVARAAREMGGLWALVNNASLYVKTPFETATLKNWDDHMNANVRAPFFLAQAAAPHLRRSRGRIVNIVDWSALRPYASFMPYCVSKAGLLCLNAALAKELAPEVLVNAVLPGPVLLPESMSAGQRRAVQAATLLKRLGSPEEVAKAVAFFLESADFSTGAALTVDGGRLIA